MFCVYIAQWGEGNGCSLLHDNGRWHVPRRIFTVCPHSVHIPFISSQTNNEPFRTWPRRCWKPCTLPALIEANSYDQRQWPQTRLLWSKLEDLRLTCIIWYFSTPDVILGGWQWGCHQRLLSWSRWRCLVEVFTQKILPLVLKPFIVIIWYYLIIPFYNERISFKTFGNHRYILTSLKRIVGRGWFKCWIESHHSSWSLR